MIVVVISRRLTKFVAHIIKGIAGRKHLDARTVTHEDRKEFEVDDYLYPEHTAPVIVVSDKALRGVQGFGDDVLALFGCSPEGDVMRFVADVFAYTDYIVKEMLGVEIRIVAERLVTGLYTDNAVEGKIIEHEVFLLAAKQEPSVAELLQQIRAKDIFIRAAAMPKTTGT